MPPPAYPPPPPPSLLSPQGGEQWCPGADVPKHLDGSLPGDYGYDPLNLGADPGALDRYREAELMHSRWCMLAVVGLTLPESLGMGSWDAAPKWMIEGGKPEYWIIGEGPWPQVSVPAVLSFQLLTMVSHRRMGEQRMGHNPTARGARSGTPKSVR